MQSLLLGTRLDDWVVKNGTKVLKGASGIGTKVKPPLEYQQHWSVISTACYWCTIFMDAVGIVESGWASRMGIGMHVDVRDGSTCIIAVVWL